MKCIFSVLTRYQKDTFQAENNDFKKFVYFGKNCLF